MALTDDNGIGATMLVTPTSGNFGGYSYPAMPMMPFMPYGQQQSGGMFGGGDSWLGILFLIALCNGGFGFGGFGGMGGMLGAGMFGMDMIYPWMNQINQMNDGFRDQQISDRIGNVHDAVTSGFGDVQLGIAGVNQNICQTGAGITSAINQGFANTNLGMSQGFNGVNSAIFGAQNAIAQQLYGNEIANLNRSFAEQSANQQGFNGVQAGIADLRYTEATEGCATRTAAAQNTRDIVDAVRGGNQLILDKLCALELDGVKGQLAQAQRENATLQNAVNMATTRAENLANVENLSNSLYMRLKDCPVGTVPVFGNQPIFTCAQNIAGSNGGCGCGNNLR